MTQVDQAFFELSAVTKRGGYLYVVTAIDGGLVEDAILDPIRDYYKKNSAFAKFIDDIEPDVLHDVVDVIEAGLRRRGENVSLQAVKPMLDVDLCVYFQNLCQPPSRLHISAQQVRDMYVKNLFKDIRQLKRYVKRENIRKFLAPLHYERDHPVSKILFGSGSVEFIGRKI